MSAKPILRELEDWRSRAATDRDWDRGREVDLLGEIIDRLAAAIAKTTEPVKPSVELLPCPLCKGRVLDNTTQHDLEKQVACEFCTFTCSMADWNRAAARGEVAVTVKIIETFDYEKSALESACALADELKAMCERAKGGG